MKMNVAIAAAVLAFCSCTSAAYLPVNTTDPALLAAEDARVQKFASKLATHGPADANDAPIVARAIKTPKIDIAPISYTAEEVLFTQGKKCSKWTAAQFYDKKNEIWGKHSAVPFCKRWEVDETRNEPYYVMRSAMMKGKKCRKGWHVTADGQFVAVKCGKHAPSEPVPDVARVLFQGLQGSQLAVPVAAESYAVKRSEVEPVEPAHLLPNWPIFPKDEKVAEGVQRRNVGGPGGREPLLNPGGPRLSPEYLCSPEIQGDPSTMSKVRQAYCKTCVADRRPGAWPHMRECRTLYDQVMEEEGFTEAVKFDASPFEDSDDHLVPLGPVLPSDGLPHEGVYRRGRGGADNRGPILSWVGEHGTKENRLKPNMCLVPMDLPVSELRKEYCESCTGIPQPKNVRHRMMCDKLHDEILAEEGDQNIFELDTSKPVQDINNTTAEEDLTKPFPASELCPSDLDQPMSELRKEFCANCVKISASLQHNMHCNKLEAQILAEEVGVFKLDTSKPAQDINNTITEEDLSKRSDIIRPIQELCPVSHDQPMSELRKEYCGACEGANLLSQLWNPQRDQWCSKFHDLVDELENRFVPDALEPARDTTTPVTKRSEAEDDHDAICTASDAEMSGARADFCILGCRTSGKQGIRCEKLAIQVAAEGEHDIPLPAFDGMPKLNSVMRGMQTSARSCARGLLIIRLLLGMDGAGLGVMG